MSPLALPPRFRLLLALLLGLVVALGGEPATAKPGQSTKPKVHRVYKGQHLGMIAKRYNVSVEALRNANGLEPKEPIRPGQKLYVPPRDDPDGHRTREIAEAAEKSKGERKPAKTAAAKKEKRGKRSGGKQGKKDSKASEPSWRSYAKPAPRRGRVELRAHEAKWRGYAVGKGNKLLPAARRAFSEMLATSDGRTIEIDPRLIRLVTKVSDTFGGRPIQVASGYRLESYARASKHKTGEAIDFSIPGVPNAALRDFLKTLPKVGVGYYPNSSFVHLDVRKQWTYWVDYAGPGEPPRYSGFWTRPPTKR